MSHAYQSTYRAVSNSLTNRTVQIGLITLAALSLLVAAIILVRHFVFKVAEKEENETTSSEPTSDEVRADTAESVESNHATTETNDGVANENLEAKNTLIRKIHLPGYGAVELLSFGTVRHGKTQGAEPQSTLAEMYLKMAGVPSEVFNHRYKIFKGLKDLSKEEDRKKYLTTLFVCCFHTSESHEEIHEFLSDIATKISTKDNEYSPFLQLEENLELLLELLPRSDDESYLPKTKIYWSKEVEHILIPRLMEDKMMNICQKAGILFSTLSGENSSSLYQAKEMDFNHQLQFIVMGDPQFVESLPILIAEIKELAATAYHEKDFSLDFVDDFLKENHLSTNNKLLQDAHFTKIAFNIY